MKTLQITIIVVLTISTILTTCVFAQNTGSVALVFLRPDKEIYFPGDSVFIHGQDDMNVTSITIGLEKNHKLMTISEESQVLQNGTFYANFTLPKDPDAQYWSLVSGPLVQDLYFKPVYLSPLKQFKSGIALKDIRCASDLQLVIKTKNHSPACIKLDDVSKLVERGWADKPNSLQEQLDLSNSCIGPTDACKQSLNPKNMTKENQTTLSIPQCVSDIQNPYAVAGYRGDILCPVIPFQASAKIVNYTGFYGVYRYLAQPDTSNFVLEPGHNGTITYRIDIGSIHSWGSEPPPNNVNITNDIEFMHDADMHDHPGIMVSTDPNSEIIQKNDSAFVTITFVTSKDARPGTYWVDLPPSFCAGGETIILTITNCEK